jgi:hypothetical protein
VRTQCLRRADPSAWASRLTRRAAAPQGERLASRLGLSASRGRRLAFRGEQLAFRGCLTAFRGEGPASEGEPLASQGHNLPLKGEPVPSRGETSASGGETFASRGETLARVYSPNAASRCSVNSSAEKRVCSGSRIVQDVASPSQDGEARVLFDNRRLSRGGQPSPCGRPSNQRAPRHGPDGARVPPRSARGEPLLVAPAEGVVGVGTKRGNPVKARPLVKPDGFPLVISRFQAQQGNVVSLGKGCQMIDSVVPCS